MFSSFILLQIVKFKMLRLSHLQVKYSTANNNKSATTKTTTTFCNDIVIIISVDRYYKFLSLKYKPINTLTTTRIYKL